MVLEPKGRAKTTERAMRNSHSVAENASTTKRQRRKLPQLELELFTKWMGMSARIRFLQYSRS